MVLRRPISDGAIPVSRELADFGLDVIDRSFDARAPVVEHLGGGLEVGEALVVAALRFVSARCPLGVAVVEEFGELVGDPPLDFVEQELGGGVHGGWGGSCLETGEVMMRRERVQDGESDTRC